MSSKKSSQGPSARELVKISTLRKRRVQGTVTRGKTAPGRHRRIDAYMLGKFTHHFTTGKLVVDHGFGAVPVTTYELRRAMDRLRLGAHILAVEILPERVMSGRDSTGITFRLGGFNLPLDEGRQVSLIKSLNVLRQYQEHEYWPSLQTLALYLEEYGIIVEGTSNPTGSLAVLNIFRKREGSLYWTETVFISRHGRPHPEEFKAVLPKNLIHKAGPGTPMDQFLSAWGLYHVRMEGWSSQVLRELASNGMHVLSSKRDAARGWWRFSPAAFGQTANSSPHNHSIS